MKYKILALDIDGTLVTTEKEVTSKVKSAVNQLQDNNIPVLIASGRPLEGILLVAKKIDFTTKGGYILAFNGGKIVEAKTKEVVYSQSIEKEYIGEICDFARENNLTILTYKDGKIITTDATDEFLEIEARINKMEVVQVDNLEEAAPDSPDKFLLVGKPEIMEKKVVQMSEQFKGRLNIFRSEPFFIEVVPMGIDKAKSLDVLLRKLGLTKDELVACGDGRNDVTMIDYAGMGVAMDNACEEVKAVANYITSSNDEDGVAKAIEKFFKKIAWVIE